MQAIAVITLEAIVSTKQHQQQQYQQQQRQ
jgi:hypothetical protein